MNKPVDTLVESVWRICSFLGVENRRGTLKCVQILNVLKGIIFIEGTFYNFLNFVLFSVYYCYTAVLFLFLIED